MYQWLWGVHLKVKLSQKRLQKLQENSLIWGAMKYRWEILLAEGRHKKLELFSSPFQNIQ